MLGVARVGHGEHEHDAQRRQQHAAERGQSAAPAERPVAEHQRQVHDVGSGKHLGDGEHLEELLARQPALPLDELALRDRQHAAEALQRQPREHAKDLGGRGGRARRVVVEDGVRRAGVHGRRSGHAARGLVGRRHVRGFVQRIGRGFGCRHGVSGGARAYYRGLVEGSLMSYIRLKRSDSPQDGATAAPQRRTFSASGLTMFVGVPLMKLTTLSNAAPKYIS